MVRRDEKSCSRRLASLFALLAILSARPIRAGNGPARLEVAGDETASPLERSVSAAIRDAEARLSRSECRQVFSDFRDGSGRTMQESLDALGQSAPTYLGSILFYNGAGYTRCDARNTFASTSPGSRVVYICATQFWEKQRREPGQAAALIIHEELHSLGLGENPPDSKEITARVIARCGQ